MHGRYSKAYLNISINKNLWRVMGLYVFIYGTPYIFINIQTSTPYVFRAYFNPDLS